MSQTAELARVKARIEALTEKTVANGCTEAEAMSAAEMVGRPLERYALSMGAWLWRVRFVNFVLPGAPLRILAPKQLHEFSF